MSSTVLVENLSERGASFSGEVIRQEGRYVELVVGVRLPFGIAVSIEKDRVLSLGHVIAIAAGCGENACQSVAYLVQIDQALNLARCHWQ